MKSSILKIIVIDNDPKFQETYSNYFSRYVDYDLKGIFKNAKDALQAFDSIQPDIIISEVSISELGGVEGVRLFRKKDANIKILVVSAQSEFTLVKKAFKNGSNGYLTKPINKDRLYDALNSIKDEGVAMSNDIAKKVIAMFQRKSYSAFSKRENQIIDYLCEGETYKTIADKLFVTPSAVNFHIQNIYLKLDVNSKSEALEKLRLLDCA
tara:strand:+ start:750 stop:1379 length:630 start_codon:yes stop_codon:yes gene_type:complete